MKGKYFFVDGKRQVEIQEFDYNYVRNSLLKVFDKNDTNPKEYFFEVVVSRVITSTGEPIYDVRRLDLNAIYFDNTNLCVLDMMKDDIYWGPKLTPRDMPLPKLKQEYEEYKAGNVKAFPVQVPTDIADIPEPKKLVRKEISENDVRIIALSEMPVDFDHSPMATLDWIENFEIRNQELTISVQHLSVEQLALVKLMKSSSDYINGVFDNLTSALEGLFPLKPSFVTRWFGNTKFEVDESNIEDIMTKLNAAVNVDVNRFSGIDEVFSRLMGSIETIKLGVEHGIVGCQYIIDIEEDPYEFEMRHERLMKVRVANGITEMSLTDIHRRFVSNYGKLNEIQTVMIPLLINRLQTQATKEVDEETVDIIRNLAKAKNN